VNKDKNPKAVSHIVEGLIARIAQKQATASPKQTAHRENLEVSLKAESFRQARSVTPSSEPSGRYDVDLAEFPLFHYWKRRAQNRLSDPIQYTDTIRGQDKALITREWKVFPGAFGFGGATTQALLFDLLQLYVEQGCQGTQIQFGTLRALLLRRGERNPSKRDYERVRRDLDILRGYDIHCKNAFWDRRRRAYVDMKWRLFGAVFFFKEAPGEGGEELPFGFVEVSPILHQVARTRGFFALGFEGRFFHALKPLEQRLAVYLSKKFISQKMHRRFADELVKALPIEATRPRDRLAILKRTAHGLLSKRLPVLQSFALERARDGRWLAVFHRKAAPCQQGTLSPQILEGLSPGVAGLVERIVAATGNRGDRLWWAQCAKRLGEGAVDRALGQLKDAKQRGNVRKPGALLTKIFKDIATEQGIALH
jgi:hypothetical protein